MPDSTETLIYINAPTLDNADECTFVKNNDFLYATVGDANKGDTADLILYDKFIDGKNYASINEPDLFRTFYKTGQWSSNSDNYSEGGDYHKSGAAGVKSSIFNTGRLKSLRFRFFTKESYNTENPQLIIPNVEMEGVDGLSEEEIRARKLEILSNPEINPGVVTKIGFFKPNFTASGNQNNWVLSAYAYLDVDNLPTNNDGWFTYNFNEEVLIKASEQAKADYKYYFFFFPNTETDAGWHNIQIGTVWGETNFRAHVYGNTETRTVAMRSVPRGSLDPTSFICAPSAGVAYNINGGQPRLIEFEYYCDTDVINEYLTENSHKHHLDIKEAQEINSLRYNAPFTKIEDTNQKLICSFRRIFLSHESLSRNNAISIADKHISSVRIPLFSSLDAADYINNGHKTAYFGNPCTYPTYLEISFDGNKWVRSDDVVTCTYFNLPGIYEWKFQREEIFNDTLYNGEGIWLRALRRDGGNGETNLLAAYVVKNGENSYFRYNSRDLVIDKDGNSISATPITKVQFDYSTRSDWFDYIENKQTFIEYNNTEVIKKVEEINNVYNNVINNSYTEINNSITEINNSITQLDNHKSDTTIHVTQEDKDKWNSIFGDGADSAINTSCLKIGKWRIFINEDGDLVIDTEALAAVGKSITFKDVE